MAAVGGFRRNDCLTEIGNSSSLCAKEKQPVRSIGIRRPLRDIATVIGFWLEAALGRPKLSNFDGRQLASLKRQQLHLEQRNMADVGAISHNKSTEVDELPQSIRQSGLT
jgi:hypothetical protein